MIEVALFPIPDVVAFPGTTMPLHVFEPRYRQMVQDCESSGRMIAVTDVLRAIHQPKTPPKQQQTLEQTLSSNQTTYKPRDVFSAGRCELIETLADGRVLINIHMSQRLRMLDEVQSLPYRIVACETIDDELSSSTDAQDGQLQASIHARLLELIGSQDAARAAELDLESWIAMSPADYSFKLFQVLRFDSSLMQQVLESQSASERLQIIWQLLSHAE
jgi:Lon protease-like protein